MVLSQRGSLDANASLPVMRSNPDATGNAASDRKTSRRENFPAMVPLSPSISCYWGVLNATTFRLLYFVPSSRTVVQSFGTGMGFSVGNGLIGRS